jgi:3-hydroxybutyryl-CoA dehydrogenase
MSIERVLVVGAGQMGSGIAQAMAQAGLTVTLSDVCEDLVVKGRNRIEKALSKSVEKNKLTREQKAAIIERVSGVVTLDEAAANVDLAIEAAAEKLDVKSEIFETLDERCPARTIFASNTSSLSITTLAARTRRAGQVIGMHFFNPAPVMNLVEVVKGLGTTAATITEINALVRRLGKTAVEVTDTPGFCGNRIMIPMINEAVFALMEGVASVEDIDNVAKLGFNHPIGPLALSDLIGNDTVLSIMEVLFAQFGDSKFRPCPLLRKYVAAGWLGRKSSKGFYDYHGERSAPTQ